MARVIFLLTV